MEKNGFNTALPVLHVFDVIKVNDELVEIQGFPHQTRGILWENSHDDRGIFLAYDNDIIYSFIYSKHTMKGTADFSAGHVKECPTMHNFQTPRHILSTVASKSLSGVFGNSGQKLHCGNAANHRHCLCC